jgi:Tol biopolymer transport system component
MNLVDALVWSDGVVVQRRANQAKYNLLGCRGRKFAQKIAQRVALLALLGLSACSWGNTSISAGLNSRFQEEQPSLSGDGLWLAFVSDREGASQILLYDLQKQQIKPLSGVNQGDAIVESPSLSRTGRYLVFISSLQGRPDVILYDRANNRADLITQTYRYWVRHPHISPDGRYITFETSRRGQWDIEVYDRGPQIELDIPDGTPVANP